MNPQDFDDDDLFELLDAVELTDDEWALEFAKRNASPLFDPLGLILDE